MRTGPVEALVADRIDVVALAPPGAGLGLVVTCARGDVCIPVAVLLPPGQVRELWRRLGEYLAAGGKGCGYEC